MASTAHRTAAEYVEYQDDDATLDRKVTLLAEWMREARHMIAFTGAGISTACGIPDFRSGMNTVLPTGAGAWTIRAEEAKTGQRVNQSGVRRVGMLQAIPSHAHMALVEMQRAGICKFLVTQNTDGLHRRSGFPTQHLAELHGNTNLERCDSCGSEYLRDFSTRNARGVLEHDTGRACGKCGGMLHDTIINFSESLPEKEIRAAFRAADRADLCLVLGSSLRVTPAASIPEIVGKKPRGRLVIVNLQATPLDDLAALRINGTIDQVMQRLMSKIGLNIPPFILHRRVQVMQWMAQRAVFASAAAGASSKYVMQVGGIEKDGTPASLFREVRMDEHARSESEPHRFSMGVSGQMPSQLPLVLAPFGHYREPPVALQVPVEPDGSVQTWLLEYDPRQGCWTRQEMAVSHSGAQDAEVARALAAVSGLPLSHFTINSRGPSSSPSASEEAKEEGDNATVQPRPDPSVPPVPSSRMAAQEEAEGTSAASASIHAAAKHPPPSVAREVFYTKASHKAILTKRVPADSSISGQSVSVTAASPSSSSATFSSASIQTAMEALPPRAVLITCAGAGGGPGQLGCAGPSSVYESLARTLPLEHNIAVLQVVYSRQSNVAVGVADVRAAIDYCIERKWGPIILMGWSMGAAVIAESGEPYARPRVETVLPTGGSATLPRIRALIFLAGQSAGVEALAKYDPTVTAFLMLHGDADDCLPARCAEAISARIPRGATKQVVILPDNHHGIQDALPLLTNYVPKLVA